MCSKLSTTEALNGGPLQERMDEWKQMTAQWHITDTTDVSMQATKGGCLSFSPFQSCEQSTLCKSVFCQRLANMRWKKKKREHESFSLFACQCLYRAIDETEVHGVCY